ncbi:Endonuclease/exonuclease/phosphatase, partial [Schizophyllum fasciatum]
STLKVAALNMNGRGHDNPVNLDGKWHRLFDLIRDKRIDILALNETHLDDAGVAAIHERFGKRLALFNSPNPDNPCAREGVTVVMNKERTNVLDARVNVLVPGRAVMVTTAWHGNLTFTYLAIYAPNNRKENEKFWDVLYSKILTDDTLPIPDAMGGDTNLVEDPMDALPMRREHLGALRAFDRLVNTLQLIDGWRDHNKGRIGYTHRQSATGTQSRIDRIYASREAMSTSQNWDIETPNFKTDHKLVSMEITNPAAPHVGRGRATWPKHLIAGDKILNDEVKKKGLNFQSALTELNTGRRTRTDADNPQTLFKSFKDDIFLVCRERARVVVPRMKKEIDELKLRIRQVENDALLDEEEKLLSLAVLQEKLETLEIRRYEKIKTSARARNKLEGETPSKYWSNLAKGRAPRDTIARLRIPDTYPARFTTRSKDMAGIARKHHDELQRKFEFALTNEDHTKAIEYALAAADARIAEDDKAEMDAPFTEEEVRGAVRTAPQGKAAGINGIPAELWQELDRRYKADEAAERPAFNVVRCMAVVYNDIHEFGVADGSEFEQGWMCPLYKKKDRSDIVNYRPITLLNTDYKIFTKCLALRL